MLGVLAVIQLAAVIAFVSTEGPSSQLAWQLASPEVRLAGEKGRKADTSHFDAVQPWHHAGRAGTDQHHRAKCQPIQSGKRLCSRQRAAGWHPM